jgi:hypothetical protein
MDTSSKGVKKLRYEANKSKKNIGGKKPGGSSKKPGGSSKKPGGGGPVKKTSQEKIRNRKGLNKQNKGKFFGGPKGKKNRN